jgi:hypothetical protein
MRERERERLKHSKKLENPHIWILPVWDLRGLAWRTPWSRELESHLCTLGVNCGQQVETVLSCAGIGRNKVRHRGSQKVFAKAVKRRVYFKGEERSAGPLLQRSAG